MAEKRVVPARMNIYTVLCLVAFLALAFATGFVWSQSVEMTKGDQPEEGASPWYVVPATADSQTVKAPAPK